MTSSPLKAKCLYIYTTILLTLPAVFLSYAGADPVSPVIDYAEATNEVARQSQRTINKLDDQTQQMLEEYRSLLLKENSLEISGNN